MSKKHKMDAYCFNNLTAIEKYLNSLESYTDAITLVVDSIILNEDEIKDAHKAIALIKRKIKECNSVKTPGELNDLLRVKRVAESRFFDFDEEGD